VGKIQDRGDMEETLMMMMMMMMMMTTAIIVMTRGREECGHLLYVSDMA
jgi:hypothetical protein